MQHDPLAAAAAIRQEPRDCDLLTWGDAVHPAGDLTDCDRVDLQLDLPRQTALRLRGQVRKLQGEDGLLQKSATPGKVAN